MLHRSRRDLREFKTALGYWIPRPGFQIPGTGFQFLLVELGFWITNY